MPWQRAGLGSGHPGIEQREDLVCPRGPRESLRLEYRRAMGMTCTLRRADDPDIRRLLANPDQASLFLHGPLPVMRPVRIPGVLGFLLRFLPVEVSEADRQPRCHLPATRCSISRGAGTPCTSCSRAARGMVSCLPPFS